MARKYIVKIFVQSGTQSLLKYVSKARKRGSITKQDAGACIPKALRAYRFLVVSVTSPLFRACRNSG